MSVITADIAAVATMPKPRRLSICGWCQVWFVLLLLCWLSMMLWPCLTENPVYVNRADNVVMTLMAAIILAALRIALLARESLHVTLFSGAELLYCSAY